jgi:hypothetical protein
VDYVTASGLFNFPDAGWVNYFVAENLRFLLRARRAVVVNAIVSECLWREAMGRLVTAGVPVVEVPSGDERERVCILPQTRPAK